MKNRNIGICVSAAVAAVMLSACSDKGNSGASSAPAALVDLVKGGKAFKCNASHYGSQGLMSEEIKLKADSLESAKEKFKAEIEKKGWIAHDCQEDLSDTGSAKAKTVSKDQYKEIGKNASLMYLYYAKSAMPVPYEDVAKTQFSDYANQSDVFKKKEMLDKVTAVIDKNIADAKGQDFVWIDMDASLGHFDMNAQTFTIEDVKFGEGYYFSFFDGDGSYKIMMKGDQNLLSFKAKSMDDAKAIESSIRGNSKQVSLRLYGQVLRAGEMDRSKYVIVEFTGAEVSDKAGRGRAQGATLLSTF